MQPVCWTIRGLRNPTAGSGNGCLWPTATYAGACPGRRKPPAVVIFLPGYSAPVNIYFETFSRLRAEGYAVAALDWPGQAGSSRGTDNPEKIHARSLDGHVDAGLSVVAEVLQRFPERPIHLVGLSMGAQIGTRMLANEPGLFASAALITPAYGLYDNRPQRG